MNEFNDIYQRNVGLIEGVHRKFDPAYARKIDDAQNTMNKFSAIALAALVVSVALTVLALPAPALLAVPIFIVSLPVAFVSYNSYRLSENLKCFLDNPKAYRNLDTSYNQVKLRERLAIGTFGFGPAIDKAMEQIKKEKF